MRVALLAATGAAVIAVTGCGGTPATRSDSASHNQTALPSEGWSPRIERWKHDLLAAANTDKSVFPTPSRAVFEQRLRRAATHFGFRVLKTDFVPAPQGAPLVIVATDSPERFSRDTPAIVKSLNARAQADGLEDWQGWDYEGLFLGAQGPDGKPFLAVFQFWRARGGGQWASRESLYPFSHG